MQATEIRFQVSGRPTNEVLDYLRGQEGIEVISVREMPKLTPQEGKVVAALKRGTPRQGLAAELGLSKSGVEFHMKNLFRKLGATSVVQLLARA